MKDFVSSDFEFIAYFIANEEWRFIAHFGELVFGAQKNAAEY